MDWELFFVLEIRKLRLLEIQLLWKRLDVDFELEKVVSF